MILLAFFDFLVDVDDEEEIEARLGDLLLFRSGGELRDEEECGEPSPPVLRQDRAEWTGLIESNSTSGSTNTGEGLRRTKITRSEGVGDRGGSLSSADRGNGEVDINRRLLSLTEHCN